MARILISYAPPQDVPNFNPPAPYGRAADIASGFAGPSAGRLGQVSVVKEGPNMFARESGVLRNANAETQHLDARARGAVSASNSLARVGEQIAGIIEKNAIESTRAKNSADLMVADAAMSRSWHEFLGELSPDPEGWQEQFTKRLGTMRTDIIDGDKSLSPLVREKLSQNLRVFEAQSRLSLDQLAGKRRISMAKAKAFSAVDSDVELGNVDGALDKIAGMQQTGMISPEGARVVATHAVKTARANHLRHAADTDPQRAMDLLSGKAEDSDNFLPLFSETEKKRLLKRATVNLAKAQADGATSIASKMDMYTTQEDFERDLATTPLLEEDRNKLRAQFDQRPPDAAATAKTILSLKDEASRLTPDNDPDGFRAQTIRKTAALEAPWAISMLDRLLLRDQKEALPSDALFKMGASYIDSHYLRTDPNPTAMSDRGRLYALDELHKYLKRRDESGSPATRDETLRFLETEHGVNTKDPLVPMPPEVSPATVKPPTQAQMDAARALSDKLGIKPELAQWASDNGQENSHILFHQLSSGLTRSMSARIAKSAGDDAAIASVLGLAAGLDDNSKLDLYAEVYRAEARKAGLDPAQLTATQIDAHIASALARREPRTPAETLATIRESAQTVAGIEARNKQATQLRLRFPDETDEEYNRRLAGPNPQLRIVKSKEDRLKKQILDALDAPEQERRDRILKLLQAGSVSTVTP